MEIAARVDVVLPHPLAAVWRASATLDALPRTFGAVAPIPGVTRAEVEGGGELVPGKVRIVHLTDGTTSREEILELVPESRHVYKLSGFPAPFSWIVRHGVSDWRFTAVPDGTRIEWSYTFTLTTPVVWPLAWAAVQLFRRSMDGNLTGIRALLAAGSAA